MRRAAGASDTRVRQPTSGCRVAMMVVRETQSASLGREGVGIRARATDNGHATAARDRSRVIAILPRGEAIRNFVYSGALDRVQEEADVTLLSVTPSSYVRDLLDGRYDRAL